MYLKKLLKSNRKMILLFNGGDLMPIIVNLDVMMAKRKISSGELAEKIGITPANLSNASPEIYLSGVVKTTILINKRKEKYYDVY